jgi:hypothetical protein
MQKPAGFLGTFTNAKVVVEFIVINAWETLNAGGFLVWEIFDALAVGTLILKDFNKKFVKSNKKVSSFHDIC